MTVTHLHYSIPKNVVVCVYVKLFINSGKRPGMQHAQGRVMHLA
jgi:hypothetical protein